MPVGFVFTSDDRQAVRDIADGNLGRVSTVTLARLVAASVVAREHGAAGQGVRLTSYGHRLLERWTESKERGAA